MSYFKTNTANKTSKANKTKKTNKAKKIHPLNNKDYNVVNLHRFAPILIASKFDTWTFQSTNQLDQVNYDNS